MQSTNHNKRSQSLVQLGLVLGILLFANIIGSFFYTHFDLTEEKRFTLTQPTVKQLKSLKDVVFVKVLLTGEFPAGFKRLQNSTKEMLEDFRGVSKFFEYQFEDPSQGTTEEINERRKQLAKQGIMPINLRLVENDETTQRLIYPIAIVNYNNRQVIVNLLENETPGVPKEVILNNSVSLLEYKLSNAIEKLLSFDRPNIVFTTGHGELEPIQTGDLEKTLRQYYDTGRLNLDSTYHIPADKVDVLIVAKPRDSFPEKHKFMIDQYIMNGGKVIWLIDKLAATLDSLQGRAEYIPADYSLNLDDQFFKYGFRLQPDVVADLECSHIPLVVGKMGNAPQFDKFKWFYYPIVTPRSNHPIVKSLDRIHFQFPGTIDTIKTKTPVLKTTLLTTSQYSKVQYNPVRLNFEILKYDPDPSKFNKPYQTVALLLEGNFPSLYENRVTDDMLQGMKKLNMEYLTVSKPTKMVVVSDGDIARNDVNKTTQEIYPLGYNRFENYMFANKDFMLNAIEYLLDDAGVIEARSKEVKLRLLDTVRAKEEKLNWQLTNILLPILFVLGFGFLYAYWRKRRYAS